MRKNGNNSDTVGTSANKGYGELVIYALIFFALVAAVFVLNIVLSNNSREDTVRIFCASHQQRSWQRALKQLEQARIGLYTMRPVDKDFKEFSKSIKTFDTVTKAIEQGGEITISDTKLQVSPPDDERTKQVIGSIRQSWNKGREDMLKMAAQVDEGKVDTLGVERALEYAVREDDAILDASQNFIIKLGEISDERVSQLQSFQIASLIFGIIVFLAMVSRATVSLRRRDSVINERTDEVVRQRDTIAHEKERIEHLLTDLKNTQTQLIQSEKMASLGQMVAGLAHEVNTPLGFVKNNISIVDRNHKIFVGALLEHTKLANLLEKGDLDDLETQLEAAKQSMEQILSYDLLAKTEKRLADSLMGLDRIEELIINLKNFSRLDEATLKRSDINEGIDSAILIATNLIKHKAEVEKQYGSNIIAECYPAQLNQVFLNLLTNAAQAMHGDDRTGGTITGKIIIKTSLENDQVLIKIQDNGKGIPKENLKKIFEPFYTTKAIGEGTGLGLAIVYKIIQQHNGSIQVQSEVGKGSVFEIRIPCKQPKTAPSTLEPAVA
ncbi:MAG: GHKL domain-containing protein [Chlorobiales bacterium]|nr:GHKL domain-containing protein [Chlorobiales bacterium]